MRLDQIIRAAKAGGLLDYESIPWGDLKIMWDPDSRCLVVKTDQTILGSLHILLCTPIRLQGLLDIIASGVECNPSKSPKKPRKPT